MSELFQASCRLCGSDDLTPAFTLDHGNAWMFCGGPTGEHGCGLIQRATRTADLPAGDIPQLSWTEQYRLRDVVAGAMEMTPTKESRALDLGCGAGELLSAYPRWVMPVGIDTRLAETAATDWGIGINRDFLCPHTLSALGEVAPGGFDIITMVGYLEEQSDPEAVLAAAQSRLAADGIVVVETPYAALALTRTLTSSFHQRAEQIFSLRTLTLMAENVGLRVVRGAMTERAGGSLRLYMVHQDYRDHDYGPWFENLARLWDEEQSLAIDGRAASGAFNLRVQARLRDIAQLKMQMMRGEEFAYVLGTDAPTLAMLEANDVGADIVSALIGRTPSEGVPEVITEEMAREIRPDVLIAPVWRRRESLEQWHEEIMAGMRLVFLEPELTVIDHHNYATELARALAVTDGPGSVETLRAALSAMRGSALRLVSRSA